MKIKLLYAWQSHKKGDVVDLQAAFAEAMVRNRQAEYPAPEAKTKRKARGAVTEAPSALL